MINFLGLGFTIGFGFILLSFLASGLSGKKEAISLRISTLVIGFLFIVFYIMPMNTIPIVRLTGILFLTALIINSLFGSLLLMTSQLLNKDLDQEKKKNIGRVLFVLAIVTSIILNFTASPTIINSVEYVLRNIIFLSLGVLIALILLWKPNKK
jgi:SNF family Na+-dependent transporter